MVVEDHVTTHAEQDCLTDYADGLGARSVDGVDATGQHVGVSILTDHVAVVERVVHLAVVGGDHTDSVQRFGEVREHAGDAVAHGLVAPLRCAVEPQGQDE